jgi:hypothetical protein
MKDFRIPRLFAARRSHRRPSEYGIVQPRQKIGVQKARLYQTGKVFASIKRSTATSAQE